jgi:GntR family transcriptional regulator / MocR family aminotransferase
MHLVLDGQGALHAQLTRSLKDAILARRFAAGMRLPATRELAATMGLSRNTVLGAYEQLEAEGFIEARTGSGSYVADLAPREQPRLPQVDRAMRIARFGRRAQELRAHLPPGRRRLKLRYNLEYGLPLVTPALQSAWRRALGRAADDTHLDYPPANGLPELRAAIAGYLARRRGLDVAPDDVIVVAGTQQALDLTARTLLEPGESALIEEPHYQGMRQVLDALGARVTAVPVDDDGLDTSRLARQRARLAIVTPSHQFPTGALLSLPRRLELLEWAQKQDAWIIEDDYDGEFRHDTRPLAALKSLDRDGRVVFVGSFSKVMFPALRLGYLVVPPALREVFHAAKWLVDRGCPAIEQRALSLLMESGQFERLVRRTGRLLAERRGALLRALERHCAAQLEVRGSSAGMHVVAWLRRHRPEQVGAICAAAEKRQLGIYDVAPYFSQHGARAGLLLGYSALSPTDLAEAGRRLGALLAEIPPAR